MIGLRLLVVAATAIVTTAISLRLLGLRRGWGSVLLAGLLGWGTAGILSLALVRWDWGADGLVVHAVALGVPATMAAAVALDLIARPGSLAVGERAGLVVAPRPFRAVGARLAVLRRYRELLRLARQEGFGPFLSGHDRAERQVDALGVRLRRVLESAGGVYIKLGQIAATRVDLLPPDVCAELGALQNRVPADPVEQIRPVLEAELGGPVERIFAEFDWQPLAAASIGQTYRARLHSGEAVVVKVQRPGVERVIARDLAALSLLADLAQRRTALGQGLRSGEVLEQFGKSLRAELDFRREVDAMEEVAALMHERQPVRIPKVYKDLCTRRLLVQERFDGCTMADVADLDTMAVDRVALAHQLLRTLLDQVLRAGFFHADPHPGNVFVFADGSLGLIDFGAVGRLDPIQQAAIVDMLAGLVRRDVSLLRDGIERVADIGEAVAPERLERMLARLMAENIRPSGAVEPTVLQDLVSLLAQFGVLLPGDLVLLARTFVTLEGTLRVLAPEVSMMSAATAILMPVDGESIVDRDAMLRDELLAVVPHLRRLPDRVDRVLMLAGRGQLRVRTVLDEDGSRIVRTLVNRTLLAMVGAVFLLVGAPLLVAADDGPLVAQDTGLFEILGYGGLLAGTVLLLRVAAAVARDGTT